MRMRISGVIAVASLGLFLGFGNVARADAIPYPTMGTPNTALYSFRAAADGNIVAYFAGTDAGFDLRLSLEVNGILINAGLALANHSSAIGQSFDFGPVKAGDSLTFVLNNLTLNANAFSDPSLNVGYDLNGSVGHQHVYATPYTQNPLIDSIPPGIYIGFEDQRFPASDFSYFDETFVVTNTRLNVVPGPIVGAGLPGLVAACGVLLALARRRRKLVA